MVQSNTTHKSCDCSECGLVFMMQQQWMDHTMTELGYVDAFREVNSDNDEFTWWPEGKQGENGWRVDLQIVSSGLKSAIEYGAIYKNQQFSNHAPLIMDYDYEM